jgi:cytochrome c oxidase cbb3-type subunit 4
MDYATSGAIYTIIVLWAYSKKSKANFDEAENLIFDDEPQQDKRESKVDE